MGTGLTTQLSEQNSLYLAIDQGGHASRALLFDACGNLLHSAYREIRTLSGEGFRVEHPADELIQSIVEACDEVIAQLDDAQRQCIRAAGLATQRSSLVAWTRQGEVLTPVISWQDRRAIDDMQWWDERRERVRELTGLWANPHYGASKIRWLLQHDAAVAAAAQSGSLCVGPVASFILHQILMEKPFKSDPSNASRSLLMNVHTCSWDDELLQPLGIDVSCLPQICPTTSNWGTLISHGLHIPVRLCTGDQSAAIFAQGLPDTSDCYVNMGTGAFVLQRCQAEQVPQRMLHSVISCDEQVCLQVVEGTVNGAARALDWMAEEYGIDNWPDKLSAALSGVENPPLFINGVSGVGSPYWLPSLANAFIPEPPNELARIAAVAESILFLICSNLFLISHLEPRRLVASGGLAANNRFVQILSDLSGLEIHRPDLFEATGRGVAFQLASRDADPDWVLQGAKFFPVAINAAVKTRYTAWEKQMSRHLQRA